jgi:predicted PurR-regulated permease PerM
VADATSLTVPSDDPVIADADLTGWDIVDHELVADAEPAVAAPNGAGSAHGGSAIAAVPAVTAPTAADHGRRGGKPPARTGPLGWRVAGADGPADSSTDPALVPRWLRVAAAWVWRIVLIAAAIVGLLWVLGKILLVVVPLTIALLLTALLSPVVGWLRRHRFPRSLGTAVVLISGIAVVAGTLTLVINEFVAGWPDLSNKSGEALKKIQSWLEHGPAHLTEKQISDFLASVQQWLADNKGLLTSSAISTANSVLHILAGMFLVLFATFFFLRDGRKISRFLLGAMPEHTREEFVSAADASWNTLVAYVRATVLVAFIDALGIGLALWIFGVEFAFPLAALVFLGAFIPIVGATLSGVVAILVALVTQGPVVALLILAAVVAVQQLEGHVLQPLIMGRAVAIHPLAVIFAIATGVVVGGIFGALVAVPLVAVLNTGVRHLRALRQAQETGGPVARTPPTGPPMPGAVLD